MNTCDDAFTCDVMFWGDNDSGICCEKTVKLFKKGLPIDHARAKQFAEWVWPYSRSVMTDLERVNWVEVADYWEGQRKEYEIMCEEISAAESEENR